MPDFRSLISRMADELDHYRQLLMDDRRETHALAVEARAALAEPEPEGPTDIELLSMAGTAVGHEIALGEYEPENECAVEAYGSELIDFARAVLARWGSPAPQPADGEVAASIIELRASAAMLERSAYVVPSNHCRRAASLLERQHPHPQPVPVSERLPGAEDCDAEGRCWIHMPDIGTAPSWRLVDPREIGPYHTHWLPASDLPLPQPS